MDGWEIARKDRSEPGKRYLLAFASAHLKGPLAALAGRAALDLRARCGSLAIMASGETARRSPNKR
jgi:hypothetical protein